MLILPPITERMLTQQLRELEADGIVIRTVFDQVPHKVVYDIVQDERSKLEALIHPRRDWGIYWSDKTGARILALEG